jgi:hypothetical protein
MDRLKLVEHVLAGVIDVCMHGNTSRLIDDNEVVILRDDRRVPVDAGNREALGL